jgi:hypothetical protein
MMQLLGYIASANTVLTVWLTGNKSIAIWYLSIANQCIWGFIGYRTHQPYLIGMAICLQILNIRGLRKWRKNKSLLT